MGKHRGGEPQRPAPPGRPVVPIELAPISPARPADRWRPLRVLLASGLAAATTAALVVGSVDLVGGRGRTGPVAYPADRAGTALLVPPRGWRPVAPPGVATGAVDLATAASIDGGGPMSVVGLRSLGFRYGVAGAWRRGGLGLLVLAYTFASPAGAEGYLHYAEATRDSDPGYASRSVQGVPGGIGYRHGTGAQGSEVTLFALGRTAFVVGVAGRGASARLADAMAVRQLTVAGRGAEGAQISAPSSPSTSVRQSS